ncbi:SIMPL domain-containing protein [Brevundimonas fluminis]|jgi:uncharacterized protein|uniref:SIMPL domain-containing protein n=1 Tax=Brevundimonas fluminis TaxID=2487274 RepID=UPI000F656D0B|nr:SIMPL domain-containing protein [Brevundimonas fluminis]
MPTDPRLIPALAVGGAIALGTAVAGGLIGQGLVNARVGDRTVTVRGLAERDVRADLAVLPLKFTASGDVLGDVQARIDADLSTVRAFLARQGYPADAVTLGQLSVADTQSREWGSQQNGPRYILSQTVVVRTGDVARVQSTSRALSELVRQGVVLQDYVGPTYVFTGLNKVRPEMIGQATAAAKTGAQRFAQDSGAALGPIRQATQGSFEILARDEVDAEGSTPDKKVRVVTTITYGLR